MGSSALLDESAAEVEEAVVEAAEEECVEAGEEEEGACFNTEATVARSRSSCSSRLEVSWSSGIISSSESSISAMTVSGVSSAPGTAILDWLATARWRSEIRFSAALSCALSDESSCCILTDSSWDTPESPLCCLAGIEAGENEE